MHIPELPFFLIPAALAAHAQSGQAGFRQRDVKFFSELFSNWVKFGGIGVTFPLHNTQVLRFLRFLCEDHQAKLIGRGRVPKYRLTRNGLFNLLSFMVNRSYLNSKADCLLSLYFLSSYSRQLRTLVATSSQDFSKAHRIEIEELLDIPKFLARQISLIDKEILRLNERIESARKIGRDYGKLKSSGVGLEGIAKHIGVHYPYELNSMRNFSELLESLPDDVLEWELSQGFVLRSAQIFSPLKDDLVRFKECLQVFSINMG